MLIVSELYVQSKYLQDFINIALVVFYVRGWRVTEKGGEMGLSNPLRIKLFSFWKFSNETVWFGEDSNDFHEQNVTIAIVPGVDRGSLPETHAYILMDDQQSPKIYKVVITYKNDIGKMFVLIGNLL